MFYIESSDNTKIAVYDFWPCQNVTNGKCVVLVHGWPLSHKIYEYQIERLLQRGYRVVTFDLRGFGDSDVPGCGYSYNQMATDLYYVIKAAKLERFILVGFSMGGAIVLRYMRKYQQYGVIKLILLAAAAPSWTKRPGYPYGLTRNYVDQLIELARTDRPQLAENFSKQLFASPHSEAVINWFRDIALSASGIGTIQTAISLRDEDGRPDLSSVHVPTVIIHGAKDQVVSNELAQIQHKYIRGSKFYNLANSGHGIMYDELEQFNLIFFKAIDN